MLTYAPFRACPDIKCAGERKDFEPSRSRKRSSYSIAVWTTIPTKAQAKSQTRSPLLMSGQALPRRGSSVGRAQDS